MERVPKALNSAVPMRKVSLRRLEATLADCASNHKPIPDAAKYLAGLQRIHYVLVYPEQKDIVLVGPGEGWKVDAKGNVVGVVTGRPVMLLDDLLVALQTAQAAARGGINCSIDPTPEGLARLQQVSAALEGSRDAQLVASRMEEALGMQRISVHGVPDTSHFARVLVAADYRMKRLGMNFEPLAGPRSAQLLADGPGQYPQRPDRRGSGWSRSTRPCCATPTGLAYELRGSGVKAMTEEDFLAANGNMQHSGKAGADRPEVGGPDDREVPPAGRGRSDFRPVAELHGLGGRRGLDRQGPPAGEGGQQLPHAAGFARRQARGVQRPEAGQEHGQRAWRRGGIRSSACRAGWPSTRG